MLSLRDLVASSSEAADLDQLNTPRKPNIYKNIEESLLVNSELWEWNWLTVESEEAAQVDPQNQPKGRWSDFH